MKIRVIIILSVLLAAAIYMWVSKPTEIINIGSQRIEELKSANTALKILLIDTLEKQDTYFNLKLKYSDSVIQVKSINNWNLIVRHVQELEKYKFISTDSIYVAWLKESRTARFD